METKAEQYYPTYKADNRDILLIEFEEAQKIANSQTKVYGQVTNILLAVATFAFSFFLDEDEKKEKVLTYVVSNSIIFCVILFIFGAILLRYFVDLQKQITINARKVVTLRTLLGLDYGHIHLTLPNWRVEGATNPFAIKYFNGWLNFKAMPFWLVTFTVNSIWWLSTANQKPPTIVIGNYQTYLHWYWGNIIISTLYLFVFRRNLNDRHETTYFNITKLICQAFRVKLIDNFEYVIYRAKLSYLELDRLKVKYENLSKTIVEIEDSNFYNNSGISIRALFRALLSRSKYFRTKFGYIQNGGSTISMQLTRSLFIPTNQNKYRRKLAEILLSLWLNKQFSKNEILRLYVASVRYESGVLGLSNALKHFFGELSSKELTNEESFFLVERLSNVSSTVNLDRIAHLTSRVKLAIDKEKLTALYQKQLLIGKLKA